jgi:uncharacterized membrane protein YkvA (DUF1232 family)
MTNAMGLPDPAAVQLPAVIARNERTVERDFWKKLLRVAGYIPFADDAAAAYFCATDPATPRKVKGILFAALAYFVMPFDVIPDFLLGLGYTDDAAVLLAAYTACKTHITDAHRARARAWLFKAQPVAS